MRLATIISSCPVANEEIRVAAVRRTLDYCAQKVLEDERGGWSTPRAFLNYFGKAVDSAALKLAVTMKQTHVSVTAETEIAAIRIEKERVIAAQGIAAHSEAIASNASAREKRNRIASSDRYDDDKVIGKVGKFATIILGVHGNIAVQKARGMISPEGYPISKEHVAKAIMKAAENYRDVNSPQIGRIIDFLAPEILDLVDLEQAKAAYNLHGPPECHMGGKSRHARIWTRWVALSEEYVAQLRADIPATPSDGLLCYLVQRFTLTGSYKTYGSTLQADVEQHLRKYLSVDPAELAERLRDLEEQYRWECSRVRSC